MIIVGGWSNLSVKFLSWIVYVPGYDVDYFHKNSERNLSVVL